MSEPEATQPTAAEREKKRIDGLVSALDPYLYGPRPGLAEAIAGIEALAVDRRDDVRDAMREVADHWHEVRTALPTLEARIAWRSARGDVRRARRLSATTLPAIADAAQSAVAARDTLDRMIATMPVEMYADAVVLRDHLCALIEALRTRPSEPPAEADEADGI